MSCPLVRRGGGKTKQGRAVSIRLNLAGSGRLVAMGERSHSWGRIMLGTLGGLRRQIFSTKGTRKGTSPNLSCQLSCSQGQGTRIEPVESDSVEIRGETGLESPQLAADKRGKKREKHFGQIKLFKSKEG